MEKKKEINQIHLELEEYIDYFERTYDTKTLEKKLKYFAKGLSKLGPQTPSGNHTMDGAIAGLQSVNSESNVFDIRDALNYCSDYLDFLEMIHDEQFIAERNEFLKSLGYK